MKRSWQHVTRGNAHIVRFGRFTFDEGTHELFEAGQLVSLQPKPTAVLAELIAARGRLVPRARLYEVAWGDTVVEFDLALNRCIRDIRAVLGDNARSPRFVATVPRRGYRLVAAVDVGPPVLGWITKQRATLVAVLASALLVSVPPALRGPLHDQRETILAFHSYGAEVDGLDRELEASLRRRLRLGGGTSLSSGLLVNGVIVPAPDGAVLEVNFVRMDDGRTVWNGRYNPLCDRIVGDPVELIGTLISREVMARS